MRSFKAYHCRALLLLLLFGFATATLHISTHLLSDQQSCEFCSGHSNPLHALAPTAHEFSIDSGTEPNTESLPRPIQRSNFAPYHQRGPPDLL